MRDDIIFYFACKGRTLVLDENEYGVTHYEGLEATDYELVKSINANHIGERMARKKLLSRPIMLEFDYIGPDDSIPKKRQELISFFAPFSAGELTVDYLGTKRTIEYEVSVFDMTSRTVFEPLSCLLELDCLDPTFKDIIQIGSRINTWVGGWKWKFTLPFRMKVRGEPQQEIINSGHVETPVEIEFHGPAVNPRITNLTTGEFIRIKRELTSDDVLYINTAFGKKTVEIERSGVREDAFDYIDLASSFFSLQPGSNIVEYQSENGLDPQSVRIYYYNRYIGV